MSLQQYESNIFRKIARGFLFVVNIVNFEYYDAVCMLLRLLYEPEITSSVIRPLDDVTRMADSETATPIS